MTESQNSPNPTNEARSRPYVNEFQEWVGESETAGEVLAAWHTVSLLVAALGVLRYGIVVAVTGAVSLLASTLVHYWRDELAPEIRHSQREVSE